MIEFFTHLIDKLNIKRLLVSLFLGSALKLFLPYYSKINVQIHNNVSKNNQEWFSFVFYILLVYVFLLLIEWIKNGLKWMYTNYHTNMDTYKKNDEIKADNINYINSLKPEDQKVLKYFMTHNNAKQTVNSQSAYVQTLIHNSLAIVIPDSERIKYTGGFNECVLHFVDIILSQSFYDDIKEMYDEHSILQNI